MGVTVVMMSGKAGHDANATKYQQKWRQGVRAGHGAYAMNCEQGRGRSRVCGQGAIRV